MSTIENIFEPSRLLLVWHHLQPEGARHRRVVGELVRAGNDASFRYLKDTDDFDAALKEGFHEFPAFGDLGEGGSHTGALDVFMRRLPPRKREDFREYLSQYSLPPDFSGSAFSLLAYTGARLASDAFELCPDLSDAKAPLDFVIEASGVRHCLLDASSLEEGQPVSFEREPENQFDENAIGIYVGQQRVGYINKAMAPSFQRLLDTGNITGEVLRFTESRNRHRLLILVRYK